MTALTPDRPQCSGQVVSGTRPARRCGRRATGADGLCGHCRNLSTPATSVLCRACGRTDVPPRTTCAEHGGVA